MKPDEIKKLTQEEQDYYWAEVEAMSRALESIQYHYGDARSIEEYEEGERQISQLEYTKGKNKS